MLLTAPKQDITGQARWDAAEARSPELSIPAVAMYLRRNRLLIAAGLLIGIVGGIAYLLLATSTYTARAELAVEVRRAQAAPGSQVSDGAYLDNSYVQTQVELLKSERVLLAVIRALDLVNHPLFASEKTGNAVKTWLKALLFGPQGEPTEFTRTRALVEHLQSNVLVEREGLTNVIDIKFRSRDPSLAANVANALARSYIEDQVEARYQAIRRAGLWLQDRIAELRDQSAAAARVVQDFKTAHQIIDTPRGRLNEQQLGEVNTQLITARAQRAEADARLERINEILKAGTPEASVSEALHNEVIVRLRGQYLEASQREAEISARLGKDHPSALESRKQMDELRRVIADEFRRIAESIRSDRDIARAREKALEAGLADSIREAAVANEALLELRDLESSANSYKAIYDAYLRNYTESLQAQSYPAVDARIVTEATPPLTRSHPKRRIVLAASLAFGLFLGVGLSFARDQLRNALYTRADVRAVTGRPALGLLPVLRGFGARASGRALYAKREPHSRFAAALRGVRTGLQLTGLSDPGTVVGISSAFEGEGRTTVAANLAWVLASGGVRVLLVDADLRKRDLTLRLGCGAKPGLTDLAASAGTTAAPHTTRIEGFDLLPSGKPTPGVDPYDVLASPALAKALRAAASGYDIVLVDLPALLGMPEGQQAVRFVDSSVIVIEWGRTNRNAVAAAAELVEGAGGFVIGCVLNKVRDAAINPKRKLTGLNF